MNTEESMLNQWQHIGGLQLGCGPWKDLSFSDKETLAYQKVLMLNIEYVEYDITTMFT